MDNALNFKPILEVQSIEDDIDYREYTNTTRIGLRFIAQVYCEKSSSSMEADFGDFVKWIRDQQPDLPLSVPERTSKIVLRSANIWLPLIQVAADTSMQVLLNMAASYLYDRAKGALKTDDPSRLHMSVVYHDKKQGKMKKFEFSGDHEALAKAIKRFDLDNFFHDNPQP